MATRGGYEEREQGKGGSFCLVFLDVSTIPGGGLFVKFLCLVFGMFQQYLVEVVCQVFMFCFWDV